MKQGLLLYLWLAVVAASCTEARSHDAPAPPLTAAIPDPRDWEIQDMEEVRDLLENFRNNKLQRNGQPAARVSISDLRALLETFESQGHEEVLFYFASYSDKHATRQMERYKRKKPQADDLELKNIRNRPTLLATPTPILFTGGDAATQVYDPMRICPPPSNCD